MKCPACATIERAIPADIAFVAGITFAFQFNNEALRKHVCEAHAAMLLRGAQAAAEKVPSEEARTTHAQPQEKK